MKELIFFDLDGTLLNNESKISSFTKDTLGLLCEKGIAYTVATGRTMHSARQIIDGHHFPLPHIFNNGVTVWDPNSGLVELDNLLNKDETQSIIDIATAHKITPFVNVMDQQHRHFIYHAKTHRSVELDLIKHFFDGGEAQLSPLQDLPNNSQITNVSMIGLEPVIASILAQINTKPNLVAYAGKALEGNGYWWLDIHHKAANKGSAVTTIKNKLGAESIICFGDGDNDLSMFKLADESYATENATRQIKQSASQTIGHHHQDGVAHFLRDRFCL